MVGVGGFEPPTSWSQTMRATRCATPRIQEYNKATIKGQSGKKAGLVSTIGAVIKGSW